MAAARRKTAARSGRQATLTSLLLGATVLVGPALAGTALAGPAEAQAAKVLHVSAAADLAPVMPVLAQLYEKKTGVKLIVSTGSSGTVVTQIENGAPADLFLGADFTFPEKLVADGLADAKAPTPYAKGSLVLIARKDSPLQPLNLERLSEQRVRKLAIADEQHAPFGRAAMAALTRLRLIDSLRPRLVIAESVMQAGQFVESGNADLGLVSLTLAKSAHFQAMTTYVFVPASQYPTIKQFAVVLAKGDRAASHQFLDWLLSNEIQVQLPNIGLDPVR